MSQAIKIFISATTSDLRSFRDAVKKDIDQRKDHLAITQDYFEPTYKTVIGLLDEKIRKCDAVICLIGFVYGAEPMPIPANEPQRSYTQREYDLARKYGKPIYIFLAEPECEFDHTPSPANDPLELQSRYRGEFTSRNRPVVGPVYRRFRSKVELRAAIAAIQFETTPGWLYPMATVLSLICLGTPFSLLLPQQPIKQLANQDHWPMIGSSGVSTATTIGAKFSEEIKTIDLILTDHSDPNRKVLTTWAVDPKDKRIVIWTLKKSLEPEHDFDVEITSAEGGEGGRLTKKVLWSFKTAKSGAGDFPNRLIEELKKPNPDFSFAIPTRVTWEGRVTRAEDSSIEIVVDGLPSNPEAVFRFRHAKDVRARVDEMARMEGTIDDFTFNKKIRCFYLKDAVLLSTSKP